jgi:hypothetical protein
LLALRLAKSRKPDIVEPSDEISETSSVASSASASTSNTGTTWKTGLGQGRRNEKRSEKEKSGRKKLSGRPGNPHEEEWLIRELRGALPSKDEQGHPLSSHSHRSRRRQEAPPCPHFT